MGMKHISIVLVDAMLERYARGKITRFELMHAIACILDAHPIEEHVIRAD